MRAADSQTGGFSGAWQIFLYNWHFYVAAFILDLLAVLLWVRFPLRSEVRIAICLLAVVATFWALSSLLVSHYVYDRSQLYRWTWLAAVLKKNPEVWTNIHAGLDQTTDSLKRLFPSERSRVLDIYLPSEMSEPSIERARRHAQSSFPAEKANPTNLPLKDGECDTVFLIFVAHELRRRKAKLRFFRELNRALQPGGCVVLVEHLRDLNNFLDYGPGAFHFFSRREWLTLSRQSNFNITGELRVTPFVRCLLLTKRSDHEISDPHPFGDASCF